MFTKSLKKMHYGRHIDNPFMSSGRSDLSFTISLTEKSNYIGGELIIEEILAPRSDFFFISSLKSSHVDN